MPATAFSGSETLGGPILFTFDFASPYAYFALDRIEELGRRHDRPVVWRPVLLWAVLKRQGIANPWDVGARAAYLPADMVRSAAFHRLPYRHPERMVSSHRAARLYYRLETEDRDKARRFGRDLFMTLFADGRDIADGGTVAELAARQGVDPERAKDWMNGADGRERLAAAIEAAVADGVFGSPFFHIDGETFFGADRLPQIEWRLSGERPA